MKSSREAGRKTALAHRPRLIGNIHLQSALVPRIDRIFGKTNEGISKHSHPLVAPVAVREILRPLLLRVAQNGDLHGRRDMSCTAVTGTVLVQQVC